MSHESVPEQSCPLSPLAEGEGERPVAGVLDAEQLEQRGHVVLELGIVGLVLYLWNFFVTMGGGWKLLRVHPQLGEVVAQEFLVEVLALAARAVASRQPSALVDDEVRALMPVSAALEQSLEVA